MLTVLKTRFHAFAAGLGVTVLLQSSTATALMLASFSAAGMVDLAPALAVMLGANVGTHAHRTVAFFRFVRRRTDTGWSQESSPSSVSTRTLIRDLGRVAIGLGLMLLSLHILLDSLAPAENAPLARELFASITGEPLLALLIGAVISWAAHSSVATVLLTMSLAYSNFVTPAAAFALVLGANLGSALNPLLEGLASGNPAHRRLPVGNLCQSFGGLPDFSAAH